MNLYEAIEEEIRSYIFRNTNSDIRFMFLDEERGISNDVEKLTTIIATHLQLDRRNFVRRYDNPNVYSKMLKKIDIGNNYFMTMPTVLLNITLGDKVEKGESNYIIQDETDIIDNKLVNPQFIINQTNTKVTIDEEMLYNQLSHEIMHSYRLYNILITHTSSDNNRKERYKKYSNNEPTDTYAERIVKIIYYLKDKDEVNANLASMANYIIRHKEINFVNYKQCVSKMPFYDKIKEMQKYGMFLNNIKGNEELAKSVGNTISNMLYDGKISYIRALNNTIYSLQKTYQYIIRQFYKILWNVLERENRIRERKEPTMITVEEFLRNYKPN